MTRLYSGRSRAGELGLSCLVLVDQQGFVWCVAQWICVWYSEERRVRGSKSALEATRVLAHEGDLVASTHPPRWCLLIPVLNPRYHAGRDPTSWIPVRLYVCEQYPLEASKIVR